MEDGSYWDQLARSNRARARLEAGRRAGVAYVGKAWRDPGREPRAGWRGTVVATDGVNVEELGVSRSAEVDEEGLAEAIERVADAGDVNPLEALRAATQEGHGLWLDMHAPDRLRDIFN